MPQHASEPFSPRALTTTFSLDLATKPVMKPVEGHEIRIHREPITVLIRMGRPAVRLRDSVSSCHQTSTAGDGMHAQAWRRPSGPEKNIRSSQFFYGPRSLKKQGPNAPSGLCGNVLTRRSHNDLSTLIRPRGSDTIPLEFDCFVVLKRRDKRLGMAGPERTGHSVFSW